MEKEKKKVAFFERIEITDPEYAQKMYEKEKNRFKFKLICGAVALVGSIAGLVTFNSSPSGNEFLLGLLSILWLLGIVASMIAGFLMNFFKVILKFGQIAYYIVPLAWLDIFAFVMGAAIGLIVCFIFPIVPCAITLYQSYNNLRDTKDYLALYYHENPTNHSSQ